MWEYITVQTVTIQGSLDELGQHGWELASVIPPTANPMAGMYDNQTYTLIFKRPVQTRV
jgi:hypothetical protein